MKPEEVKKLSPIDRLCYWVKERESIRLKKEAGKPKPWTDDKILQMFRFTNVRRMDDYVSRWLMDNWFTPFFNHKNMLIACGLARYINEPKSLEIIGFPKVWNPAKVKQQLRDHRDRGNTVFRAAYMMRGNDPGKGSDKIEAVIDYYVDGLAKYRIRDVIDTSSMEKTWEWVKERYGYGSFLAGQLVADMRWAVEGTWADRNDWASMGPGSKRGLCIIQGKDPGTPRHMGDKMNQAEFLEGLKEVTAYLKKKLPKSITNRMEAQDFQNCLCEFCKYSRTLDGTGRPKQKYQGVR